MRPIDLFTGGQWSANIAAGICNSCNKPGADQGLTSDLSRREYGISGLCQKCQDQFFNPSKHTGREIYAP